ncbi:MAG TPA: caspase family protein, partial [Acidimicrobiales bacterium]
TVVLLSGCQDHQFSRDGRVNGAFTGALLKAWKETSARKSLQALLSATAAGIPKDYDQTPNVTVIGFDIGPALTI